VLSILCLAGQQALRHSMALGTHMHACVLVCLRTTCYTASAHKLALHSVRRLRCEELSNCAYAIVRTTVIVTAL
jgi:hypothetical protein